MNDDQIDDLVRATARVSDADVARWDLTGPEHEMREAIMSSDRPTPATSDDSRDRSHWRSGPSVPTDGPDLLSAAPAERRRSRRVPAVAAACALVLAIGAGAWVARSAGEPDPIETASTDTPPPSATATEEAPATVPDQDRERIEALVANAVAPYDYETGLDAVVVGNALKVPIDEYLHECVTRRGGESSYEPWPPTDREAITQHTEFMVEDLPSLDLLAARGITGPDTAVGPVRYTTDDERELRPECSAEPDFAAVNAPNELYSQVLFPAWIQVLRDLESSPELVEPRARFVDCLVAGGMDPDPALDDRTFLQHAEGEMMDLATLPEQIEHMRTRGMLFAECGRELYGVKEQLRRAAHDTFLSAHQPEITDLATYLAANEVIPPSTLLNPDA